MWKQNKQRKVVRAILLWYRRRGRKLPWRTISSERGAYHILISEIMLQQTQVSRVLLKYPKFLKVFPSLRTLARASQKDIVLAWRGMGYNNRAVRLHKFAKAVVEHHQGKIPATFDALIRLPGIGKYTANALLSSAFGKQLPIVDVNVRRVLSRIFWKMKSTAATRSEKEIWDRAGKMIPKGKAYDWNQALMDLGAMICTARNPMCSECPVARFCSSAFAMKRSVNVRSKREPSLGGVPNRIYRGRVVNHLRNARTSVRLDVLGKEIHPAFSFKHESWLRQLLAGLTKDGLIRISGNGSPKTRRVSLA